MDTALVIITLLSVGVTAALLVYAMRLQREQRERSAARVLALRSDIHAAASATRHPLRSIAIPIPAAARTPLPQEPAARAWPPQPLTSRGDEPAADPVGDYPLGPSLFAAQPQPTRSRAIPVLIATIAIVAIAAVLVWMPRSRPATTAAAAAPPSIALSSMSNRVDGTALVVNGTIAVSHVNAGALTAVVFAFDGSGGFVASGRGPVVTSADGAGPATFEVRVPEGARAAKYRVSFRTETGIVPHVDRRTATSSPARAQ